MNTCQTCKHFHDGDKPVCRRYPPAVNIFLAEGRHHFTGQKVMQQNVMSAFPPVKATGGCGEHTTRIEFAQ